MSLCECDFVLKCIYLYIPISFCTRVHGNPLVMDPNSICRRTRTLVGRHADMCQSQPEIIQEVAKGARLGMRECQHQFHYRRWNCSSQSRNLAKILQQGEDFQWGWNGCSQPSLRLTMTFFSKTGVSERWQNLNFWMKYPFNEGLH